MASLYGGGEGCALLFRYVGTIKVDDFKREFSMWCEFEKLCNTNFNLYMVWRALFRCLEGALLADYEEFEAFYFTKTTVWRQFYTPDYADVFGRVVRVPSAFDKGKNKKDDDKLEDDILPLPFNPTT